jgi:transglutaminase-like putative cysteine protease
MAAPLASSIEISLLSALALIVFPHAYHIPPSPIGYFYLLLVWRFIGIWKPQILPKRLILTLLTLCGLALLYQQHQGFFGRDAGTSLFVTALGLKLLEMKSEREIYLINFLTFIVASSQFLFTQNILMAFYILLVCSVLLAMLVRINSRLLPIRTALSYAGWLLLQAIPLAVVLFILFPRVDPPRWLLFDDHQAKSGLSDFMEPGSISSLVLSDELVFRVKFAGALPPVQHRYWRGPVLTYTDEKRWTQAPQSSLQKTPEPPKFLGQAYRYTLLMEPQDKNWVYALDLAAEFSAPLQQNANYQLIAKDPTNKRAEYSITSYPSYNTGALPIWELQQALQLPEAISSALKQFSRQIGGGDKSPEAYSQALLSYFRSENFHYTLTPPLLDEKPIETFLFQTREGFCSHYASAFVYLMRIAGIPARVVTGYQGGEWNDVGQFLEIRQSDAHAWAEVWLAQRGWMRVDPTAAIAPERIERSINPAQLVSGALIQYLPNSSQASASLNWFRHARQLWSHVDYNWQRWVINYDNKQQKRLLSNWGVDTLKTMVYWLIGLASLIIAMLSAVLLYQRPKPKDKAVLIYQKFCQKLSRQGVSRNTGEGPKDFALRCNKLFPAYAKEIERISETFVHLRYQKATDSFSKELKHFDSLVKRFKIQR